MKLLALLAALVTFTAASIPSEKDVGVFARTLVSMEKTASFATVIESNDKVGGVNMKGRPFTSIDIYADESPSTGKPLMLLSPLEFNLEDAEADKMVATLAIRATNHTQTIDPLYFWRGTFTGHLERVPKAEIPAARAAFLKGHPEAKDWIDLQGHMFALYRFVPDGLHWVGGFGDRHYIGWVDMKYYYNAKPDASLYERMGFSA